MSHLISLFKSYYVVMGHFRIVICSVNYNFMLWKTNPWITLSRNCYIFTLNMHASMLPQLLDNMIIWPFMSYVYQWSWWELLVPPIPVDAALFCLCVWVNNCPMKWPTLTTWASPPFFLAVRYWCGLLQSVEILSVCTANQRSACSRDVVLLSRQPPQQPLFFLVLWF